MFFLDLLRCSTEKAFAKDVFIDQEQKLKDRRRSDTVLAFIISHADKRLEMLEGKVLSKCSVLW